MEVAGEQRRGAGEQRRGAGEQRRGARYPVRVTFDEHGWTGWVRMRTGQELSIRAAGLARLGVALTHLVAAIDGGDPSRMTIEPAWDVSVPGRRIGLVVVPVESPRTPRRTAPTPRSEPVAPLDPRSANRILAAMATTAVA